MRNKMYNGFLILVLIGSLSLGCSDPGTEEAGEKVEQQGITYEGSQEIFPNPERGFYDHTEAHSPGDALTPGQVASLSSENISLIIRIYYLTDFREGPISEAMLELIRNDMEVVRNAGIKAIVRFSYTNQMEGEDAAVERVEEHISQLGPVLNANKDVIAFIQAGFIGPWGEWHNSSNGLTTVENERRILFQLLEETDQDLMVQVRTPGAKQRIFETSEPIAKAMAYTNEFRARVGHHNDCFMAGPDDYGTYGNIEAEKAYINAEALYVPTGGETCPPQGDYPNCVKAREEMKLLRWTYLNRDYYLPVISKWKDSGCLDEFKRNLGYRLALVSAVLPREAAKDEDYRVQIEMTNKGFAPLYSYKKSNLVLVNQANGEQYSLELPIDLRDLKPAATFEIDEAVDLSGVPAGEYDLFLEITDGSESLEDRTEYNIRLANENTWDAESGRNSLLSQLTVLAN